jgi:hypothetical protein
MKTLFPLALLAFALACRGAAPAVPAAPAAHNGQHDFDFELGTWKTRVRRLLHPLSGSTTWVDLNGFTVVRPVWGGRANLLELTAVGSTGTFEGLSLRLYNSQSHQWSLNFSLSGDGTLGQPAIGQFEGGRGEFYDQEMYKGRAILVRFVITPVGPDSCHFEQAFSADGGKTWEINWIADDTRENGAAPQAPAN